MMYVKIGPTGLPLEVRDSHPLFIDRGDKWQSRWDWKSFEEVQRLAMYITAMTGKVHIGTDATESTSPRYDIIEIPKVGDEVSYGFNGDYYPDGVITKITSKLQITTSGGGTYRQRKNTGSWIKTGGTWSLVKGHISEQNPHF